MEHFYQGRECFDGLSQYDRDEVYRQVQSVLRENAKRDFQVCSAFPAGPDVTYVENTNINAPPNESIVTITINFLIVDSFLYEVPETIAHRCYSWTGLHT